MKLSGSLTLKLCLLLMAAASAALAGTTPTLSASPSAVDFEYTYPQQVPAPVNVNITASNGSSPALTATVTPGTGTPATLFPITKVNSTVGVGIDVGTLNTLLVKGGVYSASLVVTAAGFSPLTVPIALSVNTPLSVTATPSSLTFNLPAGPSVETISLTGASDSGVNFALTSGTSVGGDWLSITTSSDFTPATVTATVTPGNLQSGTYNGKITVTPATGSPFDIPVTLLIGVNTLSASPASLSFAYTLGGTTPLAQAVQITSSLATDTYTAETASTGDWLLVNGVTSNLSGDLPASLNVTVNPANLAVGTYQGTLSASSSNGSVLNIPVTLVVSGLSAVANPAVLAFVAQSGAPPPASQIVAINGSANATYTASVSVAWLAVSSSSGVAPTQITVSAIPAGLAAGNYSGNVQITVGSRVQTIHATLAVSASPVMTTSPGSFSFTYTGGSLPPASLILNVGVSSGGGGQVFAVGSGLPSWLQVGPATSPKTTPVGLTVSVLPQTLPSGTYLADIFLVPTAAGGLPVTVPVLLQVSGANSIVPGTSAVTFSAAAGSAPQTQTVQVTAASATSFTAAASVQSGSNWLSVSPTTAVANLANTPLTIKADATSLAEGTYQGAITLTTSQGVITQIAVTFDVGAGATPITVSPATLAFAYTVGGEVPAAQNVQITGSQSILVSAITASGGPWLSVSPATGSGNVTVSVSVNTTGLAAGPYSGTVTVTPASGPAQTVAVTLTVTPAATLSASPNPLAFSFTSGNPPPAAQTVNVTSSGPAIAFTATASSNGWLTVTPTAATTPGSISVSVDPTNLGAGSYQGSVLLSAASGTLQFTVNVTLTVVAPLPLISTVVNAASYLGGGVAPGEIIVVFGTSLGPITGVSTQIDSTGHIPTKLGNVQVTFNGYPAPLLYVSAGQVNAIVPYVLIGGSNATVEVMFGTARSNTLTLPVVSSAPGIFSADASGTGGGAIEDVNYRLVTASNPVSVGSVIQIFATGQGQTSPAGEDGLIEPLALPLPIPLLAAGVLIDGLPANIQYVGAAPGLVAGALQVNAIVPPGVSSGTVPIFVSIGGNSSQTGLTLAVH